MSSPYPNAKREGLTRPGTNNPEVVVVGTGIAGASVAAVPARGRVEVLLLERQVVRRDRVRGEYMAPWNYTRSGRAPETPDPADAHLYVARDHWDKVCSATRSAVAFPGGAPRAGRQTLMRLPVALFVVCDR